MAAPRKIDIIVQPTKSEKRGGATFGRRSVPVVGVHGLYAVHLAWKTHPSQGVYMVTHIPSGRNIPSHRLCGLSVVVGDASGEEPVTGMTLEAATSVAARLHETLGDAGSDWTFDAGPLADDPVKRKMLMDLAATLDSMALPAWCILSMAAPVSVPACNEYGAVFASRQETLDAAAYLPPGKYRLLRVTTIERDGGLRVVNTAYLSGETGQHYEILEVR